MTIPSGARLGAYEILQPIGAGGMGDVYKATDTRLGRLVAIKVLRADQVSDSNRRRRFEQEAKAASALNHPNIVTIYDIGSENDADFIVMEFIMGRSLDHVIPREGMRLSEALDHAIPVADALARAHAAGIVHRDLKPANIMVADDGTIKLLDFGLAKLVESVPVGDLPTEAAHAYVTEDGAILGTVSYMSPEQAEAKPVDARSDIFSFGAVLYEMLTGHKAFQRDSRIATLSAILREEPELLGDLPRGLDRMIARCLRKEPAKRWQSMADLRTLLQEFREDSGVEIPREPGAPPLSLFRRPSVLVAVLGALLTAAAIAAWLVHGLGSSPQAQILPAVPFTSFTGDEGQPSFSPDGSQVAFRWNGESQDNFDIYVKRIGPGNEIRLTHDPAEEGNPNWSPDGNMIAFLRDAEQGTRKVVLIPPFGGPEHVITEIPAIGGPALSLTWTPDSKSLVVFDRPASQLGGLWLLSVETGERRRLTTLPEGTVADVVPSFSPDGRTLAFAREIEANSADLYLLPLHQDLTPAGEPARVTQSNRAVWGVAWTNTGKELIMASGAPGNSALWRIAASGDPHPTRLTEHETQEVAISRGSNRLVFVQSTRELDIYRVHLDVKDAETNVSTPLIVSSRLDRYPRYSPDGKSIAFVSLRSGNWQLWVCNSDGSIPVQLTNLGGEVLSEPYWSADGKQIEFRSNPGEHTQNFVIDITGGTPHKLEDLGKDAAARLFPPRYLSSDGKLRYALRAGRVWSMPAQGGEKHEVFKYSKTIQEFELGRRGIYFLTAGTTSPGELLFYRFPDGPITRVAGAELPSQFGLSLSPDESSLLYSKLTSSGADLMLVEGFK